MLKKVIKRTAIGLSAALVLAVVAFFAIQLYINASSKGYDVSVDNAPEADCVIILGALVYKNGNPSPVLRDRLDYGYELYAAGKAKKIIVSGDHGTVEYDEVNSMKDYLIGKGVPREDIFMDHAGFDTYDSLYRAKEIFGVKTIIISTQKFHMGRALYIARRLGLEAYGYPSEDKAEYSMGYLNFREGFARVKAFLDVEIFKRNPKYSGEPIPITGDGSVTEG